MKKTGIEIISEERKRQVEVEGWTAEHDSKFTKGELADAAICYAAKQFWRVRPYFIGSFWPFHKSWYKPTPEDRIRELAKAGALIAAEIDRLLKQENQ